MTRITTQKEVIRLVAGFDDGDTRTITLEDPKGNLTQQQIDDTATLAAKALVGDKANASFTEWKEATIVHTTTTYIGQES